MQRCVKAGAPWSWEGDEWQIEREKWETEGINNEKLIAGGVADLDGSTYQGIKGGDPLRCYIREISLWQKRSPRQPSILSRSWVIAKKKRSKDKDIKWDKGDDSPTVPQEKRVVPLLMVWRSRCGGRADRGADGQGDKKISEKKYGTKVCDVFAQTTMRRFISLSR